MKHETKAGHPLAGSASTGGDGEPPVSDAARPSAPSSTALDDLTRTRLGTHLRSLYDQVVQQPVPDRFRDLIARLEASEAETGERTPPGASEV